MNNERVRRKEFSYKDAKATLNRWADPVQAMQVAYARGMMATVDEAVKRIQQKCFCKVGFGPCEICEAVEEIESIPDTTIDQPQEEVCCEWAPYRKEDEWHKTCRGDIILREGMEFCPYCGKPIKVKE